MASLVALPPGQEGNANVFATLREHCGNADAFRWRVRCFQRAVVASGDGLRADDLEAIIDAFRPILEFSVRPRTLPYLVQQGVISTVPEERRAPGVGYAWQWLWLSLDWVSSGVQCCIFPLPVAKLDPPAVVCGNYRHLISLPPLWHLAASCFARHARTLRARANVAAPCSRVDVKCGITNQPINHIILPSLPEFVRLALHVYSCCLARSARLPIERVGVGKYVPVDGRGFVRLVSVCMSVLFGLGGSVWVCMCCVRACMCVCARGRVISLGRCFACKVR